MHRVADHPVGMRGLELGNHRACLLQHPLGILRIVARKFIGVNANRVGHVGRQQCEVPVSFEKRFARGVLQNLGDIHEDFFAFLDSQGYNIPYALLHFHTSILIDMDNTGLIKPRLEKSWERAIPDSSLSAA